MTVPTPDLKIVPIQHLHAHEDHDHQRSIPLIERLRTEKLMINPPIVTPMNEHDYVILDGANRAHAFSALEYPHILVQVVHYDEGQVTLDTWNHIVAHWQESLFLDALSHLNNITLNAPDDTAILQLHLKRGDSIQVGSARPEREHRNTLFRDIVRLYQKHAHLHRTVENDANLCWDLYPDGIALVKFRPVQPQDVIEAAKLRMYLPSGVSRHIVQGRAIRVNFPIDLLRDTTQTLEQKNTFLKNWMREKLVNRNVRYYAESTYQFDE